jgi:hypothetical protein
MNTPPFWATKALPNVALADRWASIRIYFSNGTRADTVHITTTVEMRFMLTKQDVPSKILSQLLNEQK